MKLIYCYDFVASPQVTARFSVCFFRGGGSKTPTWGLINKYHTTSTYHAYYIVYRIC